MYSLKLDYNVLLCGEALYPSGVRDDRGVEGLTAQVTMSPSLKYGVTKYDHAKSCGAKERK